MLLGCPGWISGGPGGSKFGLGRAQGGPGKTSSAPRGVQGAPWMPKKALRTSSDFHRSARNLTYIVVSAISKKSLISFPLGPGEVPGRPREGPGTCVRRPSGLAGPPQ